MRTDTITFRAHNNALSKEPRFVVEQAFDEANTILAYFTSHADAALPGGGTVIATMINSLSGTSQTLNPDDANATIGNLQFNFVDVGGAITNHLGTQLALGRSTRQQRSRLYMGYKGDAFADYALIQTQFVSEIAYDKTMYIVSCNDVQRQMRQDIFEQASNTLAAPLAASELTLACSLGASTLTLASTADFPSSGSGIIRDPAANDLDTFTWTGKSATQLTGVSGVLAHGLGAMVADATIVVSFDTTGFELVPHSAEFSDAPSQTVGYVKVESEVIRYTAKTSFGFTGCVRGALNTRVANHSVDITQPAERRMQVLEYVYLEMTGIDLMYRILTGKDRLGASVMPTKWHLGISTTYVRLADFTGIGSDLWDPVAATGFPVRFEDLQKVDGKKFLETEIARLTGTFMPIHADGSVGCKRQANILAGASYVETFDETNVMSSTPLIQDFSALRNIIQINWNWEPLQKKFTRRTVLIDGPSITKHKVANRLLLEFKGLHGSRHSEAMLRGRFDAIRDRFSNPPQKTSSKVLGRFNSLEVGDVIRNRMITVRDFVSISDLDRSFEIQNISIDWVKQQVNCQLFGSSAPPTPLAATADVGFLPQAWYTGTGSPLSGAVTITGSSPAHVTVGGTLTGNAVLTNAGAIYYFDGDLQIDAGVTITLGQNVWIKVRGHLQNNGTINGIGGGLVGGTPVPDNSAIDFYHRGTAGGLGNTESGGGMILRNNAVLSEFRGDLVLGANAVMPLFNLMWNGSTLTGVPTDLRGSSGSSGGSIATTGSQSGVHFPALSWNDTFSPGGGGGNGGAGLGITARGFSQGGSGRIDLSGTDGTNAASAVTAENGQVYIPGSGAGGAPGGFFLMLDGVNVTATDIGEPNLRQFYGRTPIPGQPLANILPIGGNVFAPVASGFVGFGDGSTFDLPNLSGDAQGGTRFQYVMNAGAPVADPVVQTLPQPLSLSVASGTAELLKNGDGTIITRVKMTWSAVPDARVAGYDLQFKRSTDSAWNSAPSVLGQSSTVAWIIGVVDGVLFDFRVRAAGALREVSEWTTVTGYDVVGKLELPANVGTLTYSEPLLSWPANVVDPDLAGYVVRYQASWASSDWDSAIIPPGAGDQGFITPTEFDTVKMVGGQVTMLVKAQDTTGNRSASVSSKQIDLRPPVPTGFTVTRQPDGTREFEWILASPPSDIDGFRIKYFLGSTSDWTAMTLLQTGVLKTSPFESNQLAAGTYTFAIKSVDKAGNESATALFIDSLTIADPRIAGSIDDFKEEPLWTETKTDCHPESVTGWLTANSTAVWSSAATWSAMTHWNQSPKSPIKYERLIDIGIITPFVPLVSVVVDGSVLIEEAHSNDGSSYSSFVTLGSSEITCRFIKIRVTVTGAFPKIKSMMTILSATPIEEEITDLLTSTLTGAHRIGTGDIRLPITKAYNVVKKVDVTLQSVGPGWSWELIDKDDTVGPRIKIYNSSNTLADALIDATVKGV